MCYVYVVNKGQFRFSLSFNMGTSEKFCLKWNDFQQNVSKTFSQLRQQTGLFDVTLVGSDQKQVSSHRLVLSACSDFFKNIFHSNTHSHPLLYLDGVDSAEINLMLDYIYQGEVSIYQEYLDRFLEIANKFKLDGLLATENAAISPKDSCPSEILKDDANEFYHTDFESIGENNDDIHYENTKESTMKVVNQSFEANNSEIDSKFEELVVKENNTWRCTVCEKTSNARFNIKRHLEIHLSGLSYDCHLCGKNFRSSNSLNFHKSTKHK